MPCRNAVIPILVSGVAPSEHQDFFIVNEEHVDGGNELESVARHGQGLRATASVLPVPMKASGSFDHALMPAIML